MAIISTPALELSPRQELIFDIMSLLDQAIEGDKQVNTYDVAEEIVELLEDTSAPTLHSLALGGAGLPTANKADCRHMPD